MRNIRTHIIGLFLLLFFGLATLVSASGLWYDLIQSSSEIGVVSEVGTSLRKIPERSAQTWLQVPAGTSLRMVSSNDDFSLVETAYGVKGWVETGALYHE